MICPPDHKHAETTTCYDRHRCRCAPCTDNYRAYQRRISRLGTDGKRVAGYVDAEPARQHIVTALDAGVSFADFQRECGIVADTLRRILHRRQTRVWKRTSDAILAVGRIRIQWVPVWRAQRRVQALQAMGYTLERIARLAELAPVTVYRAARGEGDMEAVTFAALDRVFREYGLRRPEWSGKGELGGITRTRRRARALGFVPAAGWDDIDDPNEQPEGVAA